MIKACVIGASGYTGAELSYLLHKHPHFSLEGVFVSANSLDANKPLSALHGQFKGQLDQPLVALAESELSSLAKQMDAIFLATPHEASHDWMPQLIGHKASVFDLSGAFRLKDKTTFANFYGFPHQQSAILEKAVYGLADWYADDIKGADVVAVPGCYPTASLTALKPLHNAGLLDAGHRPIINATSGVSGAGRKATMTNSLCEVSLQAYGVLGHRHQPEISAHLGTDVIFTPHLGNFKRGILATVTVKLKDSVTQAQINDAYQDAYANSSIVRICQSWPKLDDVVKTPHCDLFWKFDASSGYLVATSAIDNLLKGAASQAMQCANIRFNYPDHLGLI